MAILPLPSGERPAKASRDYPNRDLLAMPHTELPVPQRPRHIDRADWRRALARYRAADRAYRRHAVARRRQPDHVVSVPFDETGLQLLAERFDQMQILVGVPAPDSPALVTKLEIVYRDVCVEDPTLKRIVGELVADARRLNSA